MSYQIYPSYSEENRFQVQNILKHLNEVFQKQLKIWRFDNKNDNLVSKKKNIVEDIKVFRSSKLLLCFVTSTYFETLSLNFNLLFLMENTFSILVNLSKYLALDLHMLKMSPILHSHNNLF